ncbi:putative GPI-anchored cell wall organization protein Ecm33 [Rosellinia necatrix]|uniref:Putative GPI-anchored cell wall organization protein Ecm33 n=1 Tax=Rosellinia necatrix TaxID=77044 RepID=A0A1S7ULR3_ROSNE|nr:putative GPI-anchored cell wall organization protein Ecm33 [Rosellinia necatrix]
MKLSISIYALSLLLGVSHADCGVDGGTIVVANPNYDLLDELEACSTIFGDILVDPAFVYLILEGPQEITGTVIAHDNEILKYVSLPDVRKLGGFSFVNPKITGRISFPEMTEIGNLEWRDITWMYEDDYLEWGAGKLVTISNLNVEGTDLSGFLRDYKSSLDDSFYYDGLEQLQNAGNVRVVGNRRMDSVVFPGLKTISGALIVGDNVYFPEGGEGRLRISLPVLESAGSVAIYDINVYRGPSGGEIDLPVLGHVFGDLNVTDIMGLTEISLPALTDIDAALRLTGNKVLKTVDFPELRRVSQVVLDGDFEKISFPALEEVSSFRVVTPGNFDCSSLGHIREIAGEFSCTGKNGSDDPEGPPSSTSDVPAPSPSDTGSSPTTTTKEPSVTSGGSTAVNQPGQTDDPATTSSPESTSGPDATGGAGGIPTSENPTNPSETEPATSGASSMRRSPFGIIFTVFKRWM